MKRLAIVSAVPAIVCALAGVSHAQWAVVDPGAIAEAVANGLEIAEVVTNTLTQIKRLESQIANEVQTLKSLDPRTFNELKDLISNGKLTYDALQRDIQSMGYNLGDVNTNFRKLFPKDQSQWKNIRDSDFEVYRDNWTAEINAASFAAARAQTSVAKLDKNNDKILSILDSSNDDSTGEVRQLQLVNQQLALIHTALVSAVQNLATTGRVMADWAAGEAGEKMAQREAKRRHLENYTNRGQPSKRLQRLP
jgi:P-type conjugative transfer protein TrbJ